MREWHEGEEGLPEQDAIRLLNHFGFLVLGTDDAKPIGYRLHFPVGRTLQPFSVIGNSSHEEYAAQVQHLGFFDHDNPAKYFYRVTSD